MDRKILITLMWSIVLLLVSNISMSFCEPWYTQMDTLLDKLFADNKKYVLPLRNHSTVLDIKVSTYFHDITNVDPIYATYTVRLSSRITWCDERVTWDPADIGESIMLPKEKIWTPSLFFPSSVDYSAYDGPWPIKYSYDGQAEFYVGQTVKNHCKFNMNYWPFDKQRCVLVIALITNIEDRFKLLPKESKIDVSNLKIAEWEIEYAEVFNDNYNSTSYIAYALNMKRKSGFYVLTTILPIVFIGFLQPFVFLLPCEAGERVGFSVTVMLSISVFLTVISDQIPKVGDPIALICVYVMLLTVSSGTMTIFVILNLQLYNRRSSRPIGPVFHKLHKLASCSFGSSDVDTASRSKVNIQHAGYPNNDDGITINHLKQDAVEDTSMTKMKKDKEIWSKDETLTWVDVSHDFDKILFLTAVIFLVVPSIAFLIYLKYASDYA